MIWGDGSRILNHGHLLYLVLSVYDPVFHYSSAEMKARGYDDKDVPVLVEKPHLYILGRCRANKVEQLAFLNTRRECSHQLTKHLQRSKCTPVVEVMCFIHGDGPEQQFEGGEQRGGNNVFFSCSGDSRSYPDLVYCFRNHHLFLADCCRIVQARPGRRKKRNGGIKPFKHVTVSELKIECAARRLLKIKWISNWLLSSAH